MARLHNILIANRGEIALRVMRTARALGYRTSAIYSEADARAPHVAFADSAVCVGPPPVAQSYLAIERILAAARRAGADAVHPGYGLLSENAEFAQACADAGLTFIGPRPESIRLMGDKRGARIAVAARGVACIPGYDGEDQTDDTLRTQAQALGFPLMVKAAAGGGGRGIRHVASAKDLTEAVARARSEARKAFGDDRLILERAIGDARHVEIQIFADSHGNAVHLGERDCSVQRRFQKLIEESPSPAVDPELRRRMGEAAIVAAKSTDYVGAGTVEMLLERSGQFYFLEMNTRLQVEHPVTELVTGHDLVAWQIWVAEGRALPCDQAALALRGHAIEARLYAEDPSRGFAPATGRVAQLSLPAAPIRVDHALSPGLRVTPHYDALLAKLIAHGSDREQARQRLLQALDELRVLGVATNQGFLRDVLQSPTFVAGEATTDFLERAGPGPTAPEPKPSTLAAAAAILWARAQALAATPAELGAFTNAAGLKTPIALECAGRRHTLFIERDARDRELHIGHGQALLPVSIERHGVQASELVVDGLRQRYDHAFDEGEQLFLQDAGKSYCFRDVTYEPAARAEQAGHGRAVAPMDGVVVEVCANPGQRVVRGQTLAVVEAMKLELRVVADVAGMVTAVHVQQGAQVKARQLLVEVTPESAS